MTETPAKNKTDQSNAQGRLQRNLAMGYDLVSGMKPKAMREKYGLKRLDIRIKFADYTRQLNHYLQSTDRAPLPYGYDDAYNRSAHEALMPVTALVLEEIGPYLMPEES